jgi:5'(3')-deoxyribonucleotidase
LFVDMDGVLADFDGAHEKIFGVRPDREADNVDWTQVHKVPGFFRNLPPMEDMKILWDGVKEFGPIILTGCPSSIPTVPQEKRDWIAEYLGDTVPVITCKSRQKYMYGKEGDILIDDRAKCGDPWIKMGGHWIVHTSAQKSLVDLRQILEKICG